MNLIKLFLILIISSSSLIGFSQLSNDSSSQFKISVPTVLIRGVKYPFTYGEDLSSLVFKGKRITIRNAGNDLFLKATADSIYYIDISATSKYDTNFIERIYFDVVSIPQPKIWWPPYRCYGLNNISINKDSIVQLQDLNIESGWQDSRNLPWKILKGNISFEKKSQV